jgi:hypothetical protein
MFCGLIAALHPIRLEDEMSEGRYHWSNTSLDAKFFGIPASAGVPWLLLLFFPSFTTIVIAAVATAFFCWLHFWKKMSPMDLLKRTIVFLTGRTKGTKNIFKD